MTNMDRKIAFLLATSPYLDTVDGEYDEAAMDLTANGVTVQKWISVKERLPEIIETRKAGVNTYRRSIRVLCACLQADGKRFVKEGFFEFLNDWPDPRWRIPGTIHSVTHWMPLPSTEGLE